MNITVTKVSVAVIQAFAWAAKAMDSAAMQRRRALKRFDKELEKRNYSVARSFLEQAGLLAFGSAKLVLLMGIEDGMERECYDYPYEDHQMCLQVDFNAMSSKKFIQGKLKSKEIGGQYLIPDFEQVLVCSIGRFGSGAPTIWILGITTLRCPKDGQSAKMVVLQ